MRNQFTINSERAKEGFVAWLESTWPIEKFMYVTVKLGRDRSIDQNKLGWAAWTDISKQVVWYGECLEPHHWKELLSHEWRAQKIVPAISGGFCALGQSTKKLRVREFSELIEVTYAFGAEKGVEWSEKAKTEYKEFASSHK